MTISWALWAGVYFQVLIGKAAPIETNTQSIRGRQGNNTSKGESNSRLHNKIKTARTVGRPGSTIGRDLLEESETSTFDRDAESYPYLASLMDESFNHICGGTLIARDMLLTAASCGKRAQLSFVHFRDGSIEDDATFEISATFPNPNYNESTGEHNTLLVQLEIPSSSTTTTSDSMVQVLLNDANAGRPSRWPVSILKEGQTLTGFNFLPIERISNDERNDGDWGSDFDETWGNWELGYIGLETCRAKVEISSEFQEFFAPEDSFCLERPNIQLLASSSEGPTACQSGEIGGPILWRSDTTGARLLLGVNTWGIGCRSSLLPDIASLVNAGGDFIRDTVCSESSDPPSYMGCPNIPAAIEDNESPSSSSSTSTYTTAFDYSMEFGIFFGAPTIAKEPSKSSKTIAYAPTLDPVTVYLLILFDSTTAAYISWTIQDVSTGALVASAPGGTYASDSDVTELVTLVPGKSYQIEVADGSTVQLDRVARTVTDFVIVVSEPPQEIATGQIGSGSTESFVFTVPVATTTTEGQLLSQLEGTIDGVSETPLTVDVGDDLPSISDAPSSAIPLEDTSSQGPSQSVTLVNPSEAPDPACAGKGETCNSSKDCCNGRCSPQKRCFSNGLENRSRSRTAVRNGHGGAASQHKGRFGYGQ